MPENEKIEELHIFFTDRQTGERKVRISDGVASRTMSRSDYWDIQIQTVAAARIAAYKDKMRARIESVDIKRKLNKAVHK
jgi:cobalamin-dependent methionine synthase I